MRQSFWNYFLTVLVSATMGAAITWLFMSQRSISDVRPISSPQPNAMTNAVAPDVSGQRQIAGRSRTTRARQRDAALGLEHHARHRVMFGVAERDQRGSDAAFGGELLCRSRENEKRFAAFLFSDVDVAPAHRFSNSC